MELPLGQLLKLVNEYVEEVERLKDLRDKESVKVYRPGEDPIEPEFTVEDITKDINELNRKIRKLRKRIAESNLEVSVSTYEGKTISLAEALTYKGQLKAELESLKKYVKRRPKERRSMSFDDNTEIEEINYNIEDVKEYVNDLSKRHRKIQAEIDKVNINYIVEVEEDLVESNYV